MNKFDLTVESILLEKDLLEERFEVLNNIFGKDIALKLWRYFQCKQGKDVGGECPSAEQVFTEIVNWVKTATSPYVEEIKNLFSTSGRSPEEFLANLYHKVVYNL